MVAFSGLRDWLHGRGIIIATCIAFAFLALASDHFLTLANLQNLLAAGATYGILAIGLTILLIAGEFDLSLGAIFVLSGIIATSLQPYFGTAAAILLGIGFGAVAGACNGAIVTKFRINAFIATLATGMVLVGLGTMITHGFQLYVADPGWGWLGNTRLFGMSLNIWVFLIFAAISAYSLANTGFGRHIHALGDDAEAARLSGLNTAGLRFAVFTFAGFSAGLAGVILVSRTGTAISGNGLSDVLFPAIAAVVVGGTSIRGGRGAIWRTILGVIFLECLRNGCNLLEIDAYFQDILRGVIILVAVSFDAIGKSAS